MDLTNLIFLIILNISIGFCMGWIMTWSYKAFIIIWLTLAAVLCIVIGFNTELVMGISEPVIINGLRILLQLFGMWLGNKSYNSFFPKKEKSTWED